MQDTDLGKIVEQTVNKASKSVANFGKDSDRTSTSIDRIGDKTLKFNNRMLALRNILGLIKIPAIFAGLGIAIQGLLALAAGAVAVAAALGPLAGLTVALPQGLLAIAAAATTVKLAFNGVTEELKELSKNAEKNVSPAVKQFALFLHTLQPLRDELRDIASSNLLPAIERGMLAAFSPLNVNSAKSIIQDTAIALGDLATRAGQEFRDPAWARSLLTISETTSRAFDKVGGSLIESLLPGLREILVAGQPLIRWLTDAVAKGMELFGMWLSNASSSGRAAKFFQETADVTYLLGKILGRLASALGAIGRAAYPLGKVILVALNEELGKLADWANSAGGQASLKAYFEASLPVLKSATLLLGAIVKMIFNVGQAADNSGLANFFDRIRTEVLPLFEDAVTGSESFGQALLDLAIAGSEFAAIILSTSGPLTAFISAIAGAAGALASLVANNPLLAQLLSTFLGVLAISKVINLTGLITMIWAAVTALRAQAVAGTVAATVQQRLNMAMRANVIGIVVTAIQLLAMGLFILWQRSETFRRAMKTLFSFLRDVAVVILKVITFQFRIFLRIMEALVDAASHLYKVGDRFKGVADKIRGVRLAVDGAIGALENVGRASTKAGNDMSTMAVKGSTALVALEKVAQGKLGTAKSTLTKLGSSLTDAFSDLSSRAMKAFDANTTYMLDNLSVKVTAYSKSWIMKAGDLTPAERELAALDAVESKRDRVLQRRKLMEDLKEAKGRPDEEAEINGKIITIRRGPDKERVKEINEQLRQLDVEDKRNTLQARALVEKKASDEALSKGRLNLQAQRDVQRDHFEKELTALKSAIAKGKLTQQQFRSETLALLARYGVSLKSSGQRLGEAFAGSLNTSMQSVQSEAVKTRDALAKILSLRKQIDDYEKARKADSNKKAGPRPGLSGLTGPIGALAPAGLQGPVGSTVIGQHVENQYVADESAARVIAAEAARKARRR